MHGLIPSGWEGGYVLLELVPSGEIYARLDTILDSGIVVTVLIDQANPEGGGVQNPPTVRRLVSKRYPRHSVRSVRLLDQEERKWLSEIWPSS